MDELLSAIDKVLEEKGLSDAAASKMAVGHAALLKNLRNRKSSQRLHPLDGFVHLVEALGLELTIGPPRPPVDQPPDAFADFAKIKRYDARVSAGPGSLVEDNPAQSDLAFRRDWLSRHGLNANSACAVTVSGESMLPTLQDGDLALLNTTDNAPIPGKIYVAVLPDGEVVVKRLSYGDGFLVLSSDNKEHGVIVLRADDLARTRLVGRVVWSGRLHTGGSDLTPEVRAAWKSIKGSKE